MTEFPQPLTPTDCDLQDFRFMPLDVARLRDSDLAADETPEACWAAVLLWCVSWHQKPAASIPDDDEWIAKRIGYWHRGKLDREWEQVRDGALRGWIKCADGRLYHPVVAEKARDAWSAKHKQRYKTECARIKKHNQRHGTDIAYPSFEQFMSPDYADPVPRDMPQEPKRTPEQCPSGQNGDVHRDTQSKGQGEGQGEVNQRSNDDVGNLIAGDLVDNSGASSSLRVDEIVAHLTQWECERGVTTARFDANQRQIGEWAQRGITEAQLRTAHGAAVKQRLADRDRTPVNAGFLDAFVAKAMAPPRVPVKALRAMTDVELENEGRLLGVSTHGLPRDQCIARLQAKRIEQQGGHAA